jgi:hypothetical protein
MTVLPEFFSETALEYRARKHAEWESAKAATAAKPSVASPSHYEDAFDSDDALLYQDAPPDEPAWLRDDQESIGDAVKEKPRRKRHYADETADEIMATKFEPIKWVVDGYLPEGFSVLAGRQKLGKTWLAIDWAIAVATGGVAMGSTACAAGDVLYIDLENGRRRAQRRISTIFPYERERPSLSRLHWMVDAPMLDDGFIDMLEEKRAKYPALRMVIIDVLQRIKPEGKASRNSYENDYSIWAPLQRWAMENGIAVVGLHHTRKGGADDPLESLSGSNGLSACADTTFVLDRDGNGTTLYVRGRDVEEKESALSFTGGLWTVIGEAADVRKTDERRSILDELKGADEAMGPADLAAATGMKAVNLRRLLHKMAKAGEIVKAGYGKYAHPDNTGHTGHTSWESKEKQTVESVTASVTDTPKAPSVTASVTGKPAHTPKKPKEIKERKPRVTGVTGVTGFSEAGHHSAKWVKDAADRVERMAKAKTRKGGGDD